MGCRTAPLFLTLLALVVGACTPGDGSSAPSPTSRPIVVGATPHPEVALLAATTVELLGADGVPAELREFDQPEDARQAVELGEVDLLPGYTGAAWLEVLGRDDPPGDPRTSYRRVRQLDFQNGVTWLRPGFDSESGLSVPPANATFAFFVRGVPALTAQLQTMSQLASLLAEQPGAQLCVDPQFADRSDGLERVLRAYDIRFGTGSGIKVQGLPPEGAIERVAAGDCIAGLATATDGRAWMRGLEPLLDDRQVFPAFVVTLQLPSSLRSERPEALTAVEPLVELLSTAMLGRWNAQVDAGQPLEDVAAAAAAELQELAAAAAAVGSTPTSSPSSPVPTAS